MLLEKSARDAARSDVHGWPAEIAGSQSGGAQHTSKEPGARSRKVEDEGAAVGSHRRGLLLAAPGALWVVSLRLLAQPQCLPRIPEGLGQLGRALAVQPPTPAGTQLQLDGLGYCPVVLAPLERRAASHANDTAALSTMAMWLQIMA